MKTETIEIAYAAEVTYLAGKSRMPKKQFVRDTFTLEVPHLDPAGVRPIVKGTADAGHRVMTMDVIASGDRILSPFRVEPEQRIHLTARDQRSTLAAFRERMAAPSTNGFYLFGHSDPWPRGKDGVTLPPDTKSISEDGRPAMEAMVRERLAGLAIHDGIVYCDRIEPVFNMEPSRHMEFTPRVTFDQDLQGYCFRLDRPEAAEAAIERMSRTGGYRRSGGNLGRETGAFTVEPGALRFREDEHNARVAANHALAILGNILAWMPTDLMPKLHELAVARDGLKTGASEPADVARILGEFEEARGTMDARLVQLKHVLAIGRDMIALSLPSDRAARMDAEDADAVNAFAPA